jgi:hypothetical protein
MVTPLKTGVLRPSKAPNLLIAPVDYTQSYQDQMNNALRLYFNQLDNYTQGANDALVTTAAYGSSYIEAYDRTSSIALNTTPTLLQPASYIPPVQNGITYDPSTGIFTFLYAGTYSLSISLNITTTAGNQFAYVYAQKNVGSGWTNNQNSGKVYDLVNGQTVQYVSPQSVYRAAGEQTRYYIWSNSNKSSLVTQTLPTVSPTVYVPAIRIQYA